MVKPDVLENEMMIYDPLALSTPWKITRQYRRIAGMNRMVYQDCDTKPQVQIPSSRPPVPAPINRAAGCIAYSAQSDSSSPGDILVAWTHAHYKQDYLVTSDRRFHRRANELKAVGVREVIYPEAAAELARRL
jgi:hypothetical protein